MQSTTINSFLTSLADRGLSPATLRAARSDLMQFVSWWEANYQRSFDLTLLVDRDIHGWRRHRQEEDGVASTTINRALSTIRRFCDWACHSDLISHDPTHGIRDLPVNDPRPRSLPNEAIDILLRMARQEPNVTLRLRDESLLALLAYTGVRVQEACSIQLRDLDLDAEMLTVRRGKGRKARRIPLHREACAILNRYLREVRCPDGMPDIGSDKEREFLLVGVHITEHGRPTKPGITTGLVRHRIQQLGHKAAAHIRLTMKREQDLQRLERLHDLARALDHMTPHMLRHSLARRMLKSGASLPEVQHILGHSRLSTTGMYLTPTEDDLREAIARTGFTR